MPRQIILFTLATLGPAALIAIGAVRGGPWVWLALAAMTILVAGLDALVHRITPATDDSEFPASTALSVTLALVHFGLLGLILHSLAGDGDHGIAGRIGLFLAAGLFMGQVSNANAHELIHRRKRSLRLLGTWVYISLLFGHHASAHPLVHHSRVATRADPSTARRGEGYYRYAARAWRSGFREGLRAETARLARAERPRHRHPYLLYAAGAAALLLLSTVFFGWRGLAVHLGLAVFAQSQLLLSDYVQHYGLMRAIGPDGRPEPIGPRHSWNSPHPASSALMLNAPRHSDHHAKPARPFPALRLPDAAAAPRLPYSLPVMSCIALYPPHWRRLMDPRAARWQEPAAPAQR